MGIKYTYDESQVRKFPEDKDHTEDMQRFEHYVDRMLKTNPNRLNDIDGVFDHVYDA